MKAVALLLVLLLPVATHAGEAGPAGIPKQDLAVLYAGDPDGARTADFEEFLGKHFKNVGTTSYEEFEPEAMEGYDVVIFDWGKVYFRENESGRLQLPKVPKLPKDFSRPMVLIGSPGIRIAEQFGARLDWL